MLRSPAVSSRAEGDDAQGAPATPLSAAFLEELAAAFARERPQGSPLWNFLVAYMQLERAFGTPPPSHVPAPRADGGADAAQLGSGAADGVAGAARRMGRRLLGSGGAVDDGMRQRLEALERAMGDVVEAFRFLAARVAHLEEQQARRELPLSGAGALVPPADLSPWAAVILDVLASLEPEAAVVHAECGRGELLAELAGRFGAARGVEPLADRAAAADGRGLPVWIGEVAPFLSDCPSGSIGALVLSGVVDRVPVASLVGLVDLVADRLAPGGVLVVLSGPEASATWSPVARDLVAGRPLQGETWALLLRRGGFEDVVQLARPADVAGGTVAVVGRRPR